MRVALVYEHLNKIGGAEHVLQAFAELFPDADWYTSVWDRERAPFSRSWRVHTPWFGRLPWLRTHHEILAPLMPFIFEGFDLSGYDLVVSIGSAEAKGVITRPHTVHVNYCLTPTRYLWSHRERYLRSAQFGAWQRWLRPLLVWLFDRLATWDQVAATRPDYMMAISTQVKKRIARYYDRNTEVIFPPVDVSRFARTRQPDTYNLKPKTYDPQPGFYLVVSRLVPYKKIDFLVRLCTELKKELVIVGTGVEYKRLKKLAGPTVHLVGHVAERELALYYHSCRAFLQANTEDFGIAMVEAQAAGKPVIAYAQGGSLDIVQDGVTGILVQSHSKVTWERALTTCEQQLWDPAKCQKNAARFDKTAWKQKVTERLMKYVQSR